MPAKKTKSTKKPAKSAAPATEAAPLPVPTSTPAPAALTPGAVLKKLDREGKVRCECTVEAEGFRFDGKLYS